MFYSHRKPRWGEEHFTPPLCKSFRKLGRRFAGCCHCRRWVDWLAVRQIHFEPSGEKRRRKSLKRTRKAASSLSGSGSVFLVVNSINQTNQHFFLGHNIKTCLWVKVFASRLHLTLSCWQYLSNISLGAQLGPTNHGSHCVKLTFLSRKGHTDEYG